MATVHEIAERLKSYVANLDSNISEAVQSVSNEILSLNKYQMLISRGNDDKALINNRTGNERLSKQYSKRQKKDFPNIFVKGNYQDAMFLEIKNKDEYLISSRHRLVKYIPEQYINVHGIAPSNRNEAYKITSPAIGKHLNNKVFK
jgi:hypothetical protein